MNSRTTLRRQVLAWVSIPLGILWLVSAFNDYDITKRFVNVAYDRALLESALDIGRQVRVLRGRVYVDLPEERPQCDGQEACRSGNPNGRNPG